MKGAGLAVVVGLAAESEAPCGTMGIGNVAPSGRGGAARIRMGGAGSSSRSGRHATVGIRSESPCGEQKILSSGTGGGPSGTGGSRGNKAWAGGHRNSCREGGGSGRMMGAGGGLKSAGAGLYSRTAGAMGDKRALTNGADQAHGSSGRAASVGAGWIWGVEAVAAIRGNLGTAGAGCGYGGAISRGRGGEVSSDGICRRVTMRVSAGAGTDPSRDNRSPLP